MFSLVCLCVHVIYADVAHVTVLPQGIYTGTPFKSQHLALAMLTCGLLSHGPDTLSDVPYLLIRRLKPPILVVWTISRSVEDQDTYVVAYTNALSGTSLTCCVHQVAQRVTVWHALRKLAFVFSRLKQCSPFQRFICAETSIASNAMMCDTDPTGVAESTLTG